eukprot:CAMPEP_0113611414 /NCGR_PEP_ID=MMETSP0017_2-20120614/5543_1 /TAXON_ID=2856 /ORGANISM="Cylindrotheca closterium" /LENGTH=536 /DNA_ID=CAMNT_0000520359 /DNA_START=95 /DNA_END=1705 /DNA_ORIENTATION=+ /assembly_acc=CAM_ASM_000147
MKFALAVLLLSSTTLISYAAAEAAAADSATDADASFYEGFGMTGDTIQDGGAGGWLAGDESYTEDAVYDGTCLSQSHCLTFSVHEIEKRCGAGTCEFLVCYATEVGMISAEAYLDAYFGKGETAEESETIAREICKQHPDTGVDYAGNMNADAEFDSGGCINTDNPNGKGHWDEVCVDPETAAASTGISTTNDATKFSTFCQVAYPGQTVHFMMHSYNRLDWDGKNAAPVTCSGSAAINDDDIDNTDRWGTSKCAPSTSDASATMGQTYFPATDGTDGGTCSTEPEGDECIWSYTAPNECEYDENKPTCYISQESVDTITTTCDAGPVVEYFEHTGNPSAEPPRVPIHDIVQNGDGTVSFKIYNPYGNYDEPIDYDSEAHKYSGDDLHNMYVVYDQANEIGNEVCDFMPASGKCATDEEYTTKCRSDGIAIITVFAAGFDSDSGAAQQVTNGEGTDVFKCCPEEEAQPIDHFNKTQTSAWTYLIHCDCPEEVDPDRMLRATDADATLDLDRRMLRSDKFQSGEYFNEETKKLHKLL